MIDDAVYLDFRRAIEIWDYSVDEYVPLGDIEEPTFYTLPSNPVRMRIEFSKIEEEAQEKGWYLSKNFIQWHMGNGEVVQGNNMSYVYYVPGVYNITIYISRSDGKVMTLGSINQETISVKIKNVVNTSIEAKPRGTEGESPGEWNELTQTFGDIEAFWGYNINIEASQISMPIDVVTTCTWQLYNEKRLQHVSLYAEAAGLVFSKTYTRGNESAPLKTAAYDDNKYAQFQKTWRFTSDSLGSTPIDITQSPCEKIYAKRSGSTYDLCPEDHPDAEFVGISGVSTVYYVDDSPAILYNGSRFAYRLSFQLDTTDWPGQYNWTHIAEDAIKNNSDYVDTPQRIVGPSDYVRATVSPAEVDRIVITSTGIDGHDITRYKFQNSQIPFVMSIAGPSGRIIKDAKPLVPNQYIFLKRFKTEEVMQMLTTTPDLGNDTYIIGLSSASEDDYDVKNISFSLNHNLSSINLYSSIACTLSSSAPIENVCIVGAINADSGLIIGQSKTFNILPAEGKDSFFKHGEEIDMGRIVNNNILQENINQNSRVASLFNAVFGNFNDMPSSLGKIIYEKIDNFVANNSDIDTCNVKSIYGLSQSLNRDLQSYNYTYPGEISRLVNILSTGVHRLIGTRDQYVDDFHDITIVDENTGDVHYGRNIGMTQLSIETYIVSAGVPIIAKELYGDNRYKIIPNYVAGDPAAPGYTTHQGINGLSSYPLSSYTTDWNWGLSYPQNNINKFSDYYDFYEYVDNNTYSLSSFSQNSGLINWNSTAEIINRSTIDESRNTFDDWFGEDGIVDVNLSFALHHGLKTIN